MQCGTTGCAIGWAASDPWFTRRGFHLEKPYGTYLVPVYRRETHFLAVTAFFDLLWTDAGNLFHPESYGRGENSKHHVIARIKRFLKEQEK